MSNIEANSDAFYDATIDADGTIHNLEQFRAKAQASPAGRAAHSRFINNAVESEGGESPSKELSPSDCPASLPKTKSANSDSAQPPSTKKAATSLRKPKTLPSRTSPKSANAKSSLPDLTIALIPDKNAETLKYATK